jgi:ArsR family transcriptional regulator
MTRISMEMGNQQGLERQVRVFRALAHPVRLSVVRRLLEAGEICACDLAELFPHDRTTVSKHLAVLREAGVVRIRRDGVRVLYSVRLGCLESLLSCMETLPEIPEDGEENGDLEREPGLEKVTQTKREVDMKELKIQILGPGCAKCHKLEGNAVAAAEALGLSCEVEHVRELDRILDFGVMTTPGLVLDGKVVSAGKVATVEEIKKLLQKTLELEHRERTRELEEGTDSGDR